MAMYNNIDNLPCTNNMPGLILCQQCSWKAKKKFQNFLEELWFLTQLDGSDLIHKA